MNHHATMQFSEKRVSSAVCKHCGSVVDQSKPVVDLNSGEISFKGRSVELTRTQAEIAFVLARNFGEYVSSDRLISGVWGGSEPEHPNNNLSVQMTYMRDRLAKVGLRTQGRPGYGGRRLTVVEASI